MKKIIYGPFLFKFKKILTQNWFLILVLIIALILKSPEIQKNYQLEDFELSTQQQVQLNPQQLKSQVIVFWASWCPPCRLELARLNQLVKIGLLKPEQVLALSIDEDESAAYKAYQERGYQFKLIWDKDSLLAQKFQINVTPTLLILNQNKIVYRTTGASILLELQLLWRL